jgi:hypothetical protein
MIRILPEQIPILPIKDIINGESVAFGVVDPGVIVQFMDRDECILIEWFDIVLYGMAFLNETSKKSEEKKSEEISAPTKG